MAIPRGCMDWEPVLTLGCAVGVDGDVHTCKGRVQNQAKCKAVEE